MLHKQYDFDNFLDAEHHHESSLFSNPTQSLPKLYDRSVTPHQGTHLQVVLTLFHFKYQHTIKSCR